MPSFSRFGDGQLSILLLVGGLGCFKITLVGIRAGVGLRALEPGDPGGGPECRCVCWQRRLQRLHSRKYVVVYLRSEALQLDNTISWYSIWNFTLLIRTNIQVIRRGFIFFSFFLFFLFLPLYYLTLRMALTLWHREKTTLYGQWWEVYKIVSSLLRTFKGL